MASETKVAKKKADPPLPNFASLFNGESLMGWQGDSDAQTHIAVWQVKNQCITTDGTSIGALVFDRAEFDHFHLRVEAMRTTGDGAAGIIFGKGYRSNFAGPSGEAGALLHVPGAFSGQLKLLKLPDIKVNIKPGQWYVHEIIAKDNRIKVLMDGKQVLDFTDPNRGVKSSRIYLWADRGAKASVRNVEIRSLP